jgi:hypothetical protein
MNDPSLHKLYYRNNSSNYVELYGINNISLSKGTSFAEQYLLGGNYSAMQVNAPEQVDLSFDRSFIRNDDLLQYTGSSPISQIYILNGSIYYLLNNLYLNSYSAAFSVGELPKISTKFTSYGFEMQHSLALPKNPTVQTYKYDVPKLGSIYIAGTDSNDLTGIYNIFSFDYSIEINRQAIFSVGTKVPEVCPILPLKINFSINSKLKNESLLINNSFSKISNKNYNFDIVVSGSQYQMNYPIRNSQLISSEISLSNINSIEVKRQFLGYYGL